MQEAKNYLLITLLVIAVIFGWFLWRDLSDNRTAIQAIRTELESVRQLNERAISRLDTISRTIDQSIVRTESIERTVEDVADRNDRSKDRLTESKRLIDETKSILESIRSTGKETEKK